MLKSWRQALYKVGLVLGGALLIYQIWTTGLALRQNQVQVVSPLWLVLAWGAIMLATGFQISAWACLMRWQGVSLSWWQFMRSYMLPFLARYMPGSVWGYLSRGQWLKHNFEVAYATSTMGSVLEVLSLLTAAGLVSLGYFITTTSGLLQLVLVGGAVGLAGGSWVGLQLAQRGRLFAWLRRRGWTEDLSAIARPERWATAVGLHGLLWLCYGGSIWLTARALGGAPAGGIFPTSFIFAVGWVAGFLFVFVPAGLGVREMTLSGLLVTNLSLSPGVASTVALLARAFVILAEVVCITAGVVINPEASKKEKPH